MAIYFEKVVKVLREDLVDKFATEYMDEFTLSLNAGGISQALREIGIGNEEITIAAITLKRRNLIEKLSSANAITPQQKQNCLKLVSDSPHMKYVDWAIQSSKKTFSELEEQVAQSDQKMGFRVTGYRVFKIRGLLTMLLHVALERAFRKKGAKAMLYFPEGTLFVTPIGLSIDPKSMIDDAKKEFAALIRGELGKDESLKAVFGGSLASRLVTLSDLFDPSQGNIYFKFLLKKLERKESNEEAKRLAKLSSFSGVTAASSTVSEVRTICSLLKAFTVLVLAGELPEVEQEKLKRAFNEKFGRSFDASRLEAVDKALREGAIEKDEMGRFYIKDNLYDTIYTNKFSAVNYALFLGDLLGRITLGDLGRSNDRRELRTVPLSEKNRLVAEALGQLLQSAKGTRKFDIVDSVINSVLDNETSLLGSKGSPFEIASKSLEAYRDSKGKKKVEIGVCPLCGAVGQGDEQASGLFGDGTQSPTNWFRAGIRISGIQTKCCKTCLLEAALRRITLPLDKPGEIIFIAPILSNTTLLEERAPSWSISPETDQKITLSQTRSLATRLAARFYESGSPDDINKFMAETLRDPKGLESLFRRKDKDRFIKYLKAETYWDSISEQQRGKDPMDVVDEVIDGRSTDKELVEIYEEFLRGHQVVKAASHHAGINVPNYFILIHSPFKREDDSDTEADFKRMVTSLVIHVATRHRVLCFENKWDFIFDATSTDAVMIPRRRKLQAIFGERVLPGQAVGALKKAIAIELFSFCGDQRENAVLEKASAHESLRGKTLRRMEEKKRMGGRYTKDIMFASKLWE